MILNSEPARLGCSQMRFSEMVRIKGYHTSFLDLLIAFQVAVAVSDSGRGTKQHHDKGCRVFWNSKKQLEIFAGNLKIRRQAACGHEGRQNKSRVSTRVSCTAVSLQRSSLHAPRQGHSLTSNFCNSPQENPPAQVERLYSSAESLGTVLRFTW